MPITAANPVISELQDRIRRLEGGAARKGEVLSFGIAEIDAKLPGGGLAYGALHEFAGGGADAVDGAAAALFVAGIAARTKGRRPLVPDAAGSVFAGAGAGRPSS